MPTLPKNSVYEVSPLHPQLWRADCTMPFYRKNFGICGVGGGGGSWNQSLEDMEGLLY